MFTRLCWRQWWGRRWVMAWWRYWLEEIVFWMWWIWWLCWRAFSWRCKMSFRSWWASENGMDGVCLVSSNFLYSLYSFLMVSVTEKMEGCPSGLQIQFDHTGPTPLLGIWFQSNRGLVCWCYFHQMRLDAAQLLGDRVLQHTIYSFTAPDLCRILLDFKALVACRKPGRIKSHFAMH